jgi:Rad3-related DNA helicase
MAFKKTPPTATTPDSPDKLFNDLPRRKYSGLLDHQGQMLRAYARDGVDLADVALQLPTGSGKTLVGLLVAEWRRRKFRERVVYLCPTRQLVNQVVEEARTKYGLDVDGFTGRIREYDPAARTRYTNADRVAVTTYNSLFNTNPYFANSHVVIVDDAHAAENYIAQLWTFRVERFKDEHQALFTALSGVLKPVLEPHLYARLTGDWKSLTDKLWVDKIPTPDLLDIANDVREVIDEYVTDLDLAHPWRMICEHLEACQFYVSSSEILIRPLIPPTWAHAPFENAKQRIFMSATLGAGGDLERLTGRRKIKRLATPDGWDRQGIGRRFFIFPGMSLDEGEVLILRRRLMKEAGRSLVLVPSTEMRDAVKEDVEKELRFTTFSADDIEETKKPFVESPEAVAIVANLYDGIDFPGNDCRLLFIEGLPRATNLQERFLMGRMGAHLLFNERVQTRVLQAVGRCTRSLNDFSAVVVTGEELPEYLADRDRRAFLHPELQAELEFGMLQSQEVDIDQLMENVRIFLEHDEAWEEANRDILATRDAAQRAEFPAMGELQAAVDHEIKYEIRLWQGDYERAFDEAREVLGKIVHADLQGYRALWHYLAGSAALLAGKEGVAGMEAQARAQFGRAKEAARSISWLVALSRYELGNQEADRRNAVVMRQIERVETTLVGLGKLHNRAYTKREKEIIEGLSGPDQFEAAHEKLGELLGFGVGKIEADATPDPWWIADDLCLVFEDHAGAKGPTAVIDATKARQAVTHIDWMQSNVPAAKDADILPVLVTPARQAKTGAEPVLKRVALWPLDDFVAWARSALGVVRELRQTFSEPGHFAWRIAAAEAFEANGMDAPSLHARLKQRMAVNELTIVP